PPQRRSATNQKKKKKGGCLGKIFIFGLVFLALAGTGAYFTRNWLANKALRIVGEELRKIGIHAEVGSIGYQPWRGLIVQDVVFFQSEKKEVEVLSVSDAACRFRPMELILGEPFSGVFTIEDGTIAFHSGGRKAAFEEIEADLLLKNEELEFKTLLAASSGLKLDVTGSLDLGGEGESDEDAPVFPDFAPLIDVMDMVEVKPRGKRPVLAIHLEPMQSEEADFPMVIDATLKGGAFSWKDVRVGAVDATAKVTPAVVAGDFPVDVKLDVSGSGLGWQAMNIGSTKLALELKAVGEGEKSSFAASVKGTGENCGWEKLVFDGIAVEAAYGSDGNVTFDSLVADGFGGKITSAGTLSLDSNRLVLKGLECTSDVIAMASAVDPGLGASLEMLEFSSPPEFSFSEAEVRLDDPLASQCNAKLLEPVNVTLDLDGAKLALTNVSLSASLSEGVLQIPDLTLNLLGGSGNAVIAIPLRGDDGPFVFDLTAAVDGVQVNEIAKLTNSEAEQYLEGDVRANYAGKAGASMADFAGGGELEINEAKLYKARFFGPLWDFLRRTATGLRGDQTQEVDMKYRLSENVFYADEMVLETALAKVLSQGSYDMGKDFLSIDVRANFKGPVGLATAVASHALEIRGEGPIDDVKFGMKNQFVGGVMKGGAAVVREGVGVAREGAEVIKDGAGAIRDRAGEAAEALRPRNILRRTRE
ncbi:MAG: hypothetical protein AAGA58_07170, partial [Verrucomicrobiota bacterium]